MSEMYTLAFQSCNLATSVLKNKWFKIDLMKLECLNLNHVSVIFYIVFLITTRIYLQLPRFLKKTSCDS